MRYHTILSDIEKSHLFQNDDLAYFKNIFYALGEEMIPSVREFAEKEILKIIDKEYEEIQKSPSTTNRHVVNIVNITLLTLAVGNKRIANHILFKEKLDSSC